MCIPIPKTPDEIQAQAIELVQLTESFLDAYGIARGETYWMPISRSQKTADGAQRRKRELVPGVACVVTQSRLREHKAAIQKATGRISPPIGINTQRPDGLYASISLPGRGLCSVARMLFGFPKGIQAHYHVNGCILLEELITIGPPVTKAPVREELKSDIARWKALTLGMLKAPGSIFHKGGSELYFKPYSMHRSITTSTRDPRGTGPASLLGFKPTERPRKPQEARRPPRF